VGRVSSHDESNPASEPLSPDQQRRLYETILGTTPDLVYVFDLQHRFRYANQALLAMWGKTWTEAAGKTCLELGYEPWHAAMHDREIDQVVATKESIRGEVPFNGANGRRIYDYIFVPVLDREGNVEAVAGTTRDVTERKGQEDLLRFLVTLNEVTQHLSDPDEIMTVTARLLGEHLHVDRCAYATVEHQSQFVVTGDFCRDVASIVGRWPVRAFGHECDRQMLANEAYIVADAETDPRIEPEDLPAYRATNIRAVICVPLHKDGVFTAAMAVHQTTPRTWSPDDIRLVELVVARCWESLERARASHSLRQSEQRLRFMAEAMPQKIFTASAKGEVNYVNPQWSEFTGVPPDQLVEWGWLELVHTEDRIGNVRLWKLSVETGKPFQIEHRFLRHDGAYRWHLTRAHAMKDADGSVLFWIGSSTDIEDQKQAEEILEHTVAARTAELQETIGELEAFSYSIAHDMRAPLRALEGFSDILLTEHAHQVDATAQGYLRRIAAAASRMDKLIQDVLNYSRIMRGPLPLASVPVGPLIRGITDTYPLLAPDKADIVIDGALPVLLGNEAMLTQVFSNLLGNAVKFVIPGVKPRVRVWAEPHETRVRVVFQDNGIGIESSQHEKIFTIFEQVVPSYGGTGIGLSIVKKAVERMGGRVGLKSAPGEGSVFWVELRPA